MYQEKFSIIIVTYNRNKFLRNCLFSFKNQTYNNFEVLVLRASFKESMKIMRDIGLSFVKVLEFYNFLNIKQKWVFIQL